MSIMNMIPANRNTYSPAAGQTYEREAAWCNPTNHDLDGRKLSWCHNSFPKYLEALAREIGERPGMFGSWVAHHLTELAQEARQLDANNPIDFDDRRAAMEHEYSTRD